MTMTKVIVTRYARYPALDMPAYLWAESWFSEACIRSSQTLVDYRQQWESTPAAAV